MNSDDSVCESDSNAQCKKQCAKKYNETVLVLSQCMTEDEQEAESGYNHRSKRSTAAQNAAKIVKPFTSKPTVVLFT